VRPASANLVLLEHVLVVIANDAPGLAGPRRRRRACCSSLHTIALAPLKLGDAAWASPTARWRNDPP